MRVYLQGLLFAIVVASTYYFVDVRFFNLDILRSVRTSFFSVFKSQGVVSENIFLYNTGTMSDTAIVKQVQGLLALKPRAVGINACDIGRYKTFVSAFANTPNVVTADCPNEGGAQLSGIVGEGNTVTHFRTSTDGFEIKLAGTETLKERGNEIEMINFRANVFYRSELNDPLIPDYPEHAIFLLGYMGDELPTGGIRIGSTPVDMNTVFGEDVANDMYYFKSSRITPMNPEFGTENISPDAYDIEISASIISTILDNNYITEVPLWLRACIMLVVCVANAGIIMLLRTRWMILNVVIYVLTFFLMIMAVSLAMVYLFASNVYLNLDGLEILMLIVSVFTVFTLKPAKKEQVTLTMK